MTREPQDRYLNSAAYIRELEVAEEKHQLDAQGVLDELAKAVAHCDKKSDEYMLARAAYFAEAQRRVGLSRTETMLRVQAAHEKRPDPVAKPKGGLRGFAKSVGVSSSRAHKLAAIGNSPNPKIALQEERQAENERQRGRYRRVSGRNVFEQMTGLWWKLSISDRHRFLTWAAQNLRKMIEAAD